MKKCILALFFALMTTVLFAQIQPICVSSGHRAVTGAVLAELIDEILEYQGISSAVNDYGLQFFRAVNRTEIAAWVLIPMSRAFSYPPNTSILAQARNLYDFLKTKRYWVEDLKMSFVEEDRYSQYISLIYTFNGREYPVRIYISYPG
jgi:hypothetical protein